MIVKFKKLDDSAKTPVRMTQGSVGFDIFYCGEDAIVEPMSSIVLDTKISIDIPPSYEIQIRSRSGLSFKHSIFVINAPSTIDQDYRGPIKVCLFNLGKESYTFKNHDRIAQLIISKYETDIQFTEVVELSKSERGSSGIGSTGR